MREEELIDKDSFLNFAKEINKRCKSFLKHNAFPDYYLMRGLKNFQNHISINKVRLEDRKPKDTNSELHELFNDAFTKKFGKPYRNGLFCFGTLPGYSAPFKYYGMPTGLTFPVGEFSFIISNQIQDLTQDMEDYYGLENKSLYDIASKYFEYSNDPSNKWRPYPGKSLKDIMKFENLKRISKVNEIVNTYEENPDLKQSMTTTRELMIWCKEYFWIHTKTWKLLPEDFRDELISIILTGIEDAN